MGERIRDLVIFSLGLAIGAWTLQDRSPQIVEEGVEKSLTNSEKKLRNQNEKHTEQKIAKAEECQLNREPANLREALVMPPSSELKEVWQALMESNRPLTTYDYLTPLLEDLSGSMWTRGQLLYGAASNAQYATEIPHNLFLEVFQNEIQRLLEHAKALDHNGVTGNFGGLEYSALDGSQILLTDLMQQVNKTHRAAFEVSAAQVDQHGYRVEDSLIAQIDWPEAFASFPAFCSIKTQVNADASRSIEWTYDAERKSHDSEHCLKSLHILDAPILVPPEER